VPFDSGRKLMSTIHPLADGLFRVMVKGAPGEILRRCRSLLHRGELYPFTPEDEERLLQVNAAMAGQALRVLGFAYRDLPALPETPDPVSIERDLVFVGLLGMIDPPREEAREAVRRCRA